MQRSIILAAVLIALALPAWAQVQSQTYFKNDSNVVVPVTPSAPLPTSAILTPSSSSAVGITPVVSTLLEASHVLKASPGNAYSVYASNLTGGTTGFLVLINAVAAPADGAITPLACAPFNTLGSAEINYAGLPPGVFSTGITAVVSSATTCFTKTTGSLTAYISGLVK